MHKGHAAYRRIWYNGRYEESRTKKIYIENTRNTIRFIVIFPRPWIPHHRYPYLSPYNSNYLGFKRKPATRSTQRFRRDVCGALTSTFYTDLYLNNTRLHTNAHGVVTVLVYTYVILPPRYTYRYIPNVKTSRHPDCSAERDSIVYSRII